MMLYVYQGAIEVGDREANQGEMVLLSKGELVNLRASQSSGVLIFIGEPIDEPVVHYGPFVMNSMEEIEKTIKEYSSGVFETY